MKIRSPLYSDQQSGQLFGLWYFSGPTGATRLSRLPTRTKASSGTPTRAQRALAHLLLRWRAAPIATLTLWHDYAPPMLRHTPPVSQLIGYASIITLLAPGEWSPSRMIYANN